MDTNRSGDAEGLVLRRGIAAGFFVIYLAFLLHLTLFRFQMPGVRPNLRPFLTIRHDIRAGGDEFRINILGNLGVFGPIGFVLPTLMGRRTSATRVVGISLGISLAIELLQWRSGVRVADVDDLTLNTLGGAAGYVAWRLARWWFAVPSPDQKA